MNATPEKNADKMIVTRLSMDRGTYCTKMLEGMYVTGQMAKNSPICIELKPKPSFSLGARIGSMNEYVK